MPGTGPRYAPDLPLEPEHLALQITLDVDQAAATVEVVLTCISRAPDARTLTLDGVDFLDLEVSDPDGAALHWHYDGDRIALTWGDGAAPGEMRRVRLAYRVEQPINGLHFGGPTPTHPTRGRSVVTDHETERARYWLACVDHPSVRTRLDLHVRAPAHMEIVATGALVGETAHEDGTRTAHWQTAHRCPSYLLCLMVGEFVRCEDGEHDGKPIAYFGLAPHTAEDLRRSFGRTGEMLRFLTEKLGSPLPWEKYYQFAAPGIGGAMENISLVSWDDLWVFDERMHAERGNIVDIINLHEMAHTWFGDLIVCRDFSHAWLKESWATYMESVWLEDTAGAEEQHYQLLIDRQAYRAEADNSYQRPIVTRRYDSSWRMFDRHLYPGGAIRLHLLRTELGDDAFWAGVRDYVRDFSGQVAETEDFRRALERRSGRYLARFFDEWIHGPGYPRLKASLSHSDGTMVLHLEQTQEDKDAGVGLFHFPIDVAVQVKDGEPWQRHTLTVEGRHAALRLPMAEAPWLVIVDPEVRLPHSLDLDPGQEALKRALTGSPWIAGRISAAEVLAKSGRRSAIRAIQQAYAQEPMWGVRVELARALGEAGTADAIDALAALLPTEGDDRVVVAVVDALARYRDVRVAAALTAWLDGGDRPYRATGQALVALGRQRGEAHLPRLLAALKDDSWGLWVRRGAVTALGETRTLAARDPLLACVQDLDEDPSVRRAAAMALATLTRDLPPQERRPTEEALADLTRASAYGLRLGAVQALAHVGAGAGAVRRARGSLTVQDQPTVERALKAIQRSGEAPEVAKLREQVETLTSRLQKLESRLSDVTDKPEDSAG